MTDNLFFERKMHIFWIVILSLLAAAKAWDWIYWFFALYLPYQWHRPHRVKDGTSKRINYSYHKYKIAWRQGWLCPICWQSLDLYVDLDHRLPLAEGGLDALSNLQLIHVKCHSVKTRKITV
jgi:5-methylcytosine-specific restriction endonuclease McrA